MFHEHSGDQGSPETSLLVQIIFDNNSIDTKLMFWNLVVGTFDKFAWDPHLKDNLVFPKAHELLKAKIPTVAF